MALGDYSPTVWANGTTPAINATNLGHIETKVNELDKGQAGIVQMYAGATVPSGWLLCNGQAVSRATYSALFTAISTTWGVGNGSTTFNVPDMREAAPVGVGTFSAVTGTTHGAEVASDVYTLGQFKDDQSQAWQLGATLGGEKYGYSDNNGSSTATIANANYSIPQLYSNAQGNSAKLTAKSDGTNGTPRVGNNTHGKRIGLNFIIKT